MQNSQTQQQAVNYTETQVDPSKVMDFMANNILITQKPGVQADLDVATKKYADDKFSQSNELIEDLKSFVDYENGIYKDGGDFLNPEMISAYNQGKSAIAILQDRINNKPIKFVGVMPNCPYMRDSLNTAHLELWENISLHGIYNPDDTITDFAITNIPDNYSIKNCSAQTSGGFYFEEDLTPGSNYFKITLLIK